MPDTFVSAHNDPNPFNLLYDGERLWLIDWETAARNDPFVDLAIAANNHTLSADVSEALLSAYLDAPLDDQARARLALMQVVVRLWSGLMMLVVLADPEGPQHTDLTAPSSEEFMEALASGRLTWNTPAASLVFAKLMLRVFLEASRTPDTARWRAIAAARG
jgi:thiamine kinase-like enzyme